MARGKRQRKSTSESALLAARDDRGLKEMLEAGVVEAGEILQTPATTTTVGAPVALSYPETPLSRRVLELFEEVLLEMRGMEGRRDLGGMLAAALERECPHPDGQPWTGYGAGNAVGYARRAANVPMPYFRTPDPDPPKPHHTKTTSMATRIRILQLAGEGYDCEQIAAYLDRDGVPTPRCGPHWSPDTVHYQLGGYIGHWTPHW